MACWIVCDYLIEGNESEILDLYNMLKQLEAEDSESDKGDFKETWLGYLVERLGGDTDKIYCRGFWSEVKYDGNNLHLSTRAAFQDPFEVIDLIKQRFPNLKITEESYDDSDLITS